MNTSPSTDPSSNPRPRDAVTRRVLVWGGVALGTALGAVGLLPGAARSALAATVPVTPGIKPEPPFRLGAGIRLGLKPAQPGLFDDDPAVVEADEPMRPMVHRVPAQACAVAQDRALFMDNVNTGETLKIAYLKQGRYLPDALKAINWLMRDRRTDEVAPIDVALLDLLDDISRAAGSQGPIKIISGYRSVKTNNALRAHNYAVARRSFHTRAMAADIALPNMDVQGLFRLAATMGRGGVGKYSSSGFVHVDVGPPRTW